MEGWCMTKDPHLCPRAGWWYVDLSRMVGWCLEHLTLATCTACYVQGKRSGKPQTLIPPPPLARVFYAGHQGPKCAQHALSRRSNGKGVGEGGTSTPRWGAPTLHARTQRTKLSFPVHRQMTTSSEYSGLYLQAYRMLMVLKKPH